MGTLPKKLHLWFVAPPLLEEAAAVVRACTGFYQCTQLHPCHVLSDVFVLCASQYLYLYESTVEFSLLRIAERSSCIVVRNIKDTLASDSYWALSHKTLSRGVSSSINEKRRLLPASSPTNHHHQPNQTKPPHQQSTRHQQGINNELHCTLTKKSSSPSELLNIIWT